MENNLHQRWIQLPKVRVEFENVLTVNSKHVSLPDITPEILGDYIDIGREEIDYELNRVVKRQKFWDETFQATQPPIILLGKLALSEHEYNVFTAATRFNKDRVSVNVSNYKSRIEATGWLLKNDYMFLLFSAIPRIVVQSCQRLGLD